MTPKLKNTVSDFRQCEKGVTLVEYGVAVALAVLLGAAAFQTLADDVDDSLTAASNEMVDS